MPWAGDGARTSRSPRTHAVFPFFPMITDMDGAEEGRAVLTSIIRTRRPWSPWCPATGPPRTSAGSAAPNTTAGHMMNAVTEGSKGPPRRLPLSGQLLRLFPDAIRRDHAGRPAYPDPTDHGHGLQRRRVHPEGAAASALRDAAHTDDRYQGRPYRYGFMICYRGPRWDQRHRPHRSQDRRAEDLGPGPQRRRAGTAVRAPAARTPPKATAGCWCWSAGWPRTAATSPSSTLRTSRPDRWPWSSCPPVCARPSTAPGPPAEALRTGLYDMALVA